MVADGAVGAVAPPELLLLPVAEPDAEAAGAPVVGVAKRDRIDRSLIYNRNEREFTDR